MKKFRNGLYAILNADDPDSPDYRIADFLIKNVPKVGSMSIADIANGSFTSKSSVSRFCRRLGYRDFQSMSQTMQHSQVFRYRRYDEYVPIEDGGEAADLYLMQLRRTVEDVGRYATPERIDHLTDLIFDHEKIGIFGQMHSLPVAMHFQMELSTIERFANCYLMQPEQERYIMQAGSDTVIFVISCTGKYFEYFSERASFHSSNRPYLVLLTNNRQLKVCPPYDEVHIVPCEDNTAGKPFSLQLFIDLIMMNVVRRRYGAKKLDEDDE